jgi:NADPH:quinone reductase-like Zn-dependent oxidoreductase
MVTYANQVIPLPDDVDFEQGSMLLVNPLTAFGLLDYLKKHKAKAGI